MNAVMYLMFLVLAAAMMFVVIVRLLFHASYREPEGQALNRFLETCRSPEPLRGFPSLGWIGQLLDVVNCNRHQLREAVERFRRRTEWGHAEQKIVGTQATAVGMLFTLVSLTTAATGTLDPTVVIAVGVMSSVYGLVIAIPGTMLHDIFQRRVDRFLDQADAVLAALDATPDAPTGAIVPPPIAARVASHTSKNGRGHRSASPAHRKTPTGLPTPTPDSPSPHAAAYAAYDDNFEGQALEWVSDQNGEDLDHD